MQCWFCNKMLVLVSIVFGFTLSYGFYYDFDYFARTRLPELNLSETLFSSLLNYEVNATLVSETKYPWIAKVIHSITTDFPYLCTASCVRERVFITAARCILNLKVKHTSVIYQNKHQLPVLVFVIPSNLTKQSYDDIGFIVVKKTNETVAWKAVQLYNATNRTDDRYEWFSKLPKEEYMAVGYATKKGLRRFTLPSIPFNLTELKVRIGLDLCPKILTDSKTKGFNVPCYHSCSAEQYRSGDALCSKYHGVEGGAIIEIKSNKLLAVVTWGATHDKCELPTGLSVVNSESFFKDYECAKAIASQKSELHNEPLYWQKVCDKL